MIPPVILAKPPTNPPMNAVTIINTPTVFTGKIAATFALNIESVDASMYHIIPYHNSPTPSNPARNDINPLCRKNKPVRKAPIAIVHHGKNDCSIQLNNNTASMCDKNLITLQV